MIEGIMKELMEAETAEEILAHKIQLLELYNEVYDKIRSNLSITNFDDIEYLHRLEAPMTAYYGLDFYSQCGIPFLKKHNLKTIEVIEYSILFYSIQILELLENGFFDKASLCFYNKEDFDQIDHFEEISLAEYKYNRSLFAALWFYFTQIITIEDGEREFVLEYDDKMVTFYLSDKQYEEVIDILYANYNGSKYSEIIGKILGSYRLRFTKMRFILNYQPLFVEVAYRYFCAIS